VPQGRIDEETTCNIGIISGGAATNIVPDLVTIKCEARSRNPEKLHDITEKMRNAFLEGAKRLKVAIDVNVTKSYGSYVLSPTSDVISIAEKTAKEIGLKAELKGTGGGSDANNFNNYGVPCATLGVGMQKVHTCDEFIIEEDLYKTAEWIVAIIRETANKAS
ncbi:MAG TPA: M20/M25/M40 family metallo-hydrolase, partial [Candidatus Avacidaminococcus intestinavium]|nr:M20/M25/M40 family metallo-hydrolase [Candidatus Avacidaminococcus intestinavium]